MNMKKVLVINGSRNYVSKGYKIISKIQKGLDSNKFEMVLFDPNKLQLEFCRGCKNCFNTGKCPLDLKDSGKLLKDSMIEADFIIFLSPVYAHNVSGDIKNIIDRLSYWLHLFPLLHYSALLAGVVIAISLFFVFISILNTKIMFNMNAKELILQSKVQNVIVEFFEGVETIKSLKIEEKFGEKWKDTFFEQQDINYQKNKISIIFNSIISGGSTVYRKRQIKQCIEK